MTADLDASAPSGPPHLFGDVGRRGRAIWRDRTPAIPVVPSVRVRPHPPRRVALDRDISPAVRGASSCATSFHGSRRPHSGDQRMVIAGEDVDAIEQDPLVALSCDDRPLECGLGSDHMDGSFAYLDAVVRGHRFVPEHGDLVAAHADAFSHGVLLRGSFREGRQPRITIGRRPGGCVAADQGSNRIRLHRRRCSHHSTRSASLMCRQGAVSPPRTELSRSRPSAAIRPVQPRLSDRAQPNVDHRRRADTYWATVFAQR
jgi:hypothetical protein